MSRCSCGSPASYGPSLWNGTRRGLCNGCYTDLPAGRRHLYEPSTQGFGELGTATWLDRSDL